MLSRVLYLLPPGKGRLGASWGIGSVVSATEPVEEISFESNRPLRYSLTTATQKPVAATGGNGGLKLEPLPAGMPVLTREQATELNRLAQRVENALGPQPYGWDIEWAIDEQGKFHILQARPNMK